MPSISIVVSSETGFTKQYGEWLAESINAKCYDWETNTKEILDGSDIVVFGCAIHGSEMMNIRSIQKYVKKNRQKRYVFFAVGVYPMSETVIKRIKNYNFDNPDEIEFFYFPGGMKKELLNSADKTLLTIYKAMLKRRRALTEDDKTVIDRLSVNGDYSSKEFIGQIIDIIKK